MWMISRWWARGAAVLSGLVLAVTVPALAWAAQAPGTVAPDAVTLAVEAARRRGRISGVFLVGGLCCLFVVGLIALTAMVIARRRRR